MYVCMYGPLISDRPRCRRTVPFSFVPGVQPSTLSPFDDLEDCTVPNTSTLFVSKRTDGFVEALSSPNIHFLLFSFALSGQERVVKV